MTRRRLIFHWTTDSPLCLHQPWAERMTGSSHSKASWKMLSLLCEYMQYFMFNCYCYIRLFRRLQPQLLMLELCLVSIVQYCVNTLSYFKYYYSDTVLQSFISSIQFFMRGNFKADGSNILCHIHERELLEANTFKIPANTESTLRC